jgi:SSS family solute:Na+ symporter
MHAIDLLILVVYIAGCTALGSWLGSRSQGLSGYFLGEKNIPAWAVMISIVATETSTATFLSVPGVAYRPGGDFTYLQLAMGYILGRFLVASLLLPSYFRGSMFTAYEVLNRRFGGATRTTASVLFLVTRTLGDGLRLFLAALVLRELTGWGIGPAILAMGAATIVYTYLGGMKAVIWTDVIQFFIYILGAIAALAILVGELPGGWSRLVEQASAAGKFRVFDFTFDLTRPYTFWAGVIGGMVLNTATHGADQLMVQRYLSARSQKQAAGALIASGFVIFAQFSLFLLIGAGLSVLFQVKPPSPPPRADGEFILFIRQDMPAGLVGLVVAAIFSAAMSTLSGSLNASASATVNDLVRPVVPDADERQLLRLSKRLTVVWGLAQMGVALGATGLKDNVVNNALAIASFVTGIILGLFLLGILTTRVGQGSALAGLVAGITAVALVKFATPVAWPWYALVGSSTVVLVGLATSLVLPAPKSLPTPPAGPFP